MSELKLTEYSHGAGCGCKIAPNVLDAILKSQLKLPTHENLLVGNQTRDDAAVYDFMQVDSAKRGIGDSHCAVLPQARIQSHQE